MTDGTPSPTDASPTDAAPIDPAAVAAATPLQIVLDCIDPHAQCDWWAGVLGYEVEQHEEFIQGILDAGYATEDMTMRHDGVLSWRDATAMRDPEGGRPRWYLQRVPEEKAVKNRMHVDLHVGPDAADAVVEHLLGLGATKLYDGQQGPQRWVTMADPEGNEFCVS